MARFEDVTIRNAEQLCHMGELGDLLKTIGTDRQRIGIPDEPEEVPIVYQFCKGKQNGETADVTPDKVIGGVTNIHIDEEGNLVGNVRISPMMRLSEHYQGKIDNLLVAKTVPLEEDGEIPRSANPVYELKQFIVYDKLITKEGQKQQQAEQSVQKTYAAPKEVYDVSPNAGENLHKMIQNTNQELQKVLENDTWKGHKVE